jgi:hypothetical protein
MVVPLAFTKPVPLSCGCLLLKVPQSVEERYPSVETPDWVMPMVPVVVNVPPVIGAVVATDVTVPTNWSV